MAPALPPAWDRRRRPKNIDRKNMSEINAINPTKATVILWSRIS